MKRQTASEFQRVNSRRTWTVISFLAALVLVTLMIGSYLVALLVRDGGAELVAHYRQAGECVRDNLTPLAAATERYYRGRGRYPERIEDLYPVFLERASTLHCPADTEKDAGKSSYIYHPPVAEGPEQPLLVCPHHGPLILRMQSRGARRPGRTQWEARAQPRPESQK